jgi:5-aminopentanamidase
MNDLDRTIAVAQMDCSLGDVGANLDKIEKFAGLARVLGAQLVVFPECATTGYFVGDALPSLADHPDGPIARQLATIANQNRVHLICGLYTQENGIFRNSQMLFAPDGELLGTYHKAHLFAAERTVYSAGDHPMVIDTALGRIGMTICYDLIFPEYVLKLVRLGANLIINSTDWINDPYQRDVWGWTEERVQSLASTRALENVLPLAMACRVGHETAGPNLAFDSMGPSCVISQSGKFIARLDRGEGLAVGKIAIKGADLERWQSIATYRADRRPELYR